MLIFHDAAGKIQNIIFDPVPEGYDLTGRLVVEKNPTPWPKERVYLADGTRKRNEKGKLEWASKGADYFQVDLFADYVKDGDIAKRPVIEAMPTKSEIAADGDDTAVIAGLPDPITLKIDGADYEVTGGTLEFTADAPGTYRLEIDQWPYMPWSFEVVAK